MPTYAMLINGELTGSSRSLDVINPATEEVAATCPRATHEHLNQAVEAAACAFPKWRAVPWHHRAETLLALADAIESKRDDIPPVITLEQGKPLAESRMEVERALSFARALATFTQEPEILQDDAVRRVELHRKPLGVVGAIVPWNVPFMQSVYKIVPAILTGNTVVLKTSPTTPLNGLLLGSIIKDIVPPGVVNVLTDGGDIGPLLTQHPQVAKVSFTGSTVVGKAVMANAAQSLKRLTLELGGNDAAIVLDDVDTQETAPKIFRAAFFNSGQVCVAIKRIYVQDAIYDPICEAMAKLARQAKVGDGMDPDTEFGPLHNKKQFEAARRYLDLAHQYGKVIAGGQPLPRKGYFVPPTVVRDITEGNPLVDEETFGPVRPLLRFRTIDEAIERANRTPYGLGNSVWTRNLERASRIADRLESGTVWVNQHIFAGPHIPFGGAKQSGIGVEFGKAGLAELTRVHVVNFSRS